MYRYSNVFKLRGKMKNPYAKLLGKDFDADMRKGISHWDFIILNMRADMTGRNQP